MNRSLGIARIALIGAIGVWLVGHGAGGPRAVQGELPESSKRQAIQATEEAPEVPPPAAFFPRGRHPCKAYGGLMLPLGNGTVDISDGDDGSVLLVVEIGKQSYSAKFPKDLSECRFQDRVNLPSSKGFEPASGGALGDRVSRTWSTDRYTVVVGILKNEPLHVVYLRDRATNDPLVVAKFPQKK